MTFRSLGLTPFSAKATAKHHRHEGQRHKQGQCRRRWRPTRPALATAGAARAAAADMNRRTTRNVDTSAVCGDETP